MKKRKEKKTKGKEMEERRTNNEGLMEIREEISRFSF